MASLFAWPAVAEAADRSLEERLTALERQMAALIAENRELRARLEAAPTPAAERTATTADSAVPKKTSPDPVGHGGKAVQLTLGGLLQVQGEAGGTPDPRWHGQHHRVYLRRARLTVGARWAEDFSARAEVDFGNAAIAGRSGTTAQATDLFVEWKPEPSVYVRLGQFKTPFGHEQLASDPTLISLERSVANDALTVGRQVGAAFGGTFGERRFSYAAGLFNGTGANSGHNENDRFLVAGRVAGLITTVDLGGQLLRWTAGANAFVNDLSGAAFTGRREGYGLDTQIEWGPALVQAEWLRNDFAPQQAPDRRAEGWSLLGAWSFAGDLWQIMARAERYDADTGAAGPVTRLWTFGLNYRLRGDDLRFSLNYLLGRPTGPGGASDERLLGRVQVAF